MTWQGGPLPFEADAIASIWDTRKCIYWVYRVGDSLYFRVRGSKPDYPISEPSLIGTGYYGTGSLMIWADGFLNIFWPNKDAKKVMQKYIKATDIPDPSAGAVVPLDPKLRVSSMVSRFGYPIMISPVLIPTYGIEKSLDESLFIEGYLNRGAKDGLFNSARFFSFGVWEDFTFDRVLFPYKLAYPSYDNQLFDCSSRNPLWLETLDRRIGQMVERGFTPIITLIDNCSLHKKAGGWWNLHPWNGNKNVNDTSTWNESIYHFYEDEHKDKPGMKETAAVVEVHVRSMVKSLDAKYQPNIIWEICNESHAGEGWHKLLRGWMREEGVIDDWRVMTSMDPMKHSGGYPFLEFYKKQMSKYLNYAAHGVQTVDQYTWMKQWFKSGVKFQASEDGLEPSDEIDYRNLVKTILFDRSFGWEGNQRPYFTGNIFDPSLWNWKIIQDIADGWKDFLNS